MKNMTIAKIIKNKNQLRNSVSKKTKRVNSCVCVCVLLRIVCSDKLTNCITNELNQLN